MMTRAALAAWRAHLAADASVTAAAVRILNETEQSNQPAVERATDTQQAGAVVADTQPAPAAAEQVPA